MKINEKIMCRVLITHLAARYCLKAPSLAHLDQRERNGAQKEGGRKWLGGPGGEGTGEEKRRVSNDEIKARSTHTAKSSLFSVYSSGVLQGQDSELEGRPCCGCSLQPVDGQCHGPGGWHHRCPLGSLMRGLR